MPSDADLLSGEAAITKSKAPEFRGLSSFRGIALIGTTFPVGRRLCRDRGRTRRGYLDVKTGQWQRAEPASLPVR
jgi:hypothetical protein